MPSLSTRTEQFTDSVIRRMTRISAKYGAINLSQGFPDFDPPKELLDRLAQVAYEGPHQYALTWGAQNFREALARKQEHFSGLAVDPNKEIVVTCGSTEAMMAAVIVILLVKVMPIFQQVFRQLGTEMTGFSRALMGLGTALNRYSILFIVLLLLVIAAAFAGTHTAGGRRFFRKIGLHFSRIRSMQEQLSVCRFASGMAISLKSGLTQEQSLELTERLIEDTDFCKKLEACRNGLSEGQDLAALLHQEQILTGVYARMASIGARTGELDAVLERIADLCQEDLDDRMNRTLAVLEPTLVITLSLIVGVILLSAMLPLMGILSSL